MGEAARRLEDQPLTPSQEAYLAFWTAFRDYLFRNSSSIRPVKPTKENWSTYGIGRSSFALNAIANQVDKWVRGEVWIGGDSAKAFYSQLNEQQAEIDKEFGEPLDWQELPDAKGCRIAFTLENVDPAEETDWPRQHEFLKKTLELFDGTFRERIKRLTVPDDPVK